MSLGEEKGLGTNGLKNNLSEPARATRYECYC